MLVWQADTATTHPDLDPGIITAATLNQSPRVASVGGKITSTGAIKATTVFR